MLGRWSGSVLRGMESREVLRHLVDRIHLLDLKSGVQTAVLKELVQGRRTTRELVNLIYGEDRGAATYESNYTRVRRALKSLESRGYVSSSLFGREKTYRLTRHGERTLMNVTAGREPPSLLGKMEIFLLVVTCFVGVFGIFSLEFTGSIPSLVSVAFFILLGMSLCRAVSRLWEVG